MTATSGPVSPGGMTAEQAARLRGGRPGDRARPPEPPPAGNGYYARPPAAPPAHDGYYASSSLPPLVAWDAEREARGRNPDPPYARCPLAGCPVVARTPPGLAALVEHVRRHQAEINPDPAPVTFGWPVPPPGSDVPPADGQACPCGCGLPVLPGPANKRFATLLCRNRWRRQLPEPEPEPEPGPAVTAFAGLAAAAGCAPEPATAVAHAAFAGLATAAGHAPAAVAVRSCACGCGELFAVAAPNLTRKYVSDAHGQRQRRRDEREAAAQLATARAAAPGAATATVTAPFRCLATVR